MLVHTTTYFCTIDSSLGESIYGDVELLKVALNLAQAVYNELHC